MKLSIATLLVGSAAATSIRASSSAGSKLLSNARRLNGDGDMTWVANYSLKFEKCATTSDYYGGQFDGNNNNNNNQQQQQGNQYGMYERKVVHFKLCPTDTCGSGCSGGADYVVDMEEFVGSYLEYKMELQEQECETAKKTSGCENYDDEEGCLYTYFTKMSLSQCIEQEGGENNGNGQQEEEFDLQEAAECSRLDVDEEAAQYYAYQNGGQNYNQYQNQNAQNANAEFFVGPTCSSNGKSINLAVYMDETCSYSAPAGVYEKFHYGKKLPYSSSSIIEHDCISCLEPAEEEAENNNQDGNNNNYNYNYNQNDAQAEVLEVCERLYEPAAKCETNLQIYGMYPNTWGCDFISGLNHWSLAGVTSSLKSAKKNVTPSVLAGVFAATTVIFAAVAYKLNQRVKRRAVGLMPYDEDRYAAQHVPY